VHPEKDAQGRLQFQSGGVPAAPNEFLQKVGVTTGQRDLTKEARAEAKLAGLAA